MALLTLHLPPIGHNLLLLVVLPIMLDEVFRMHLRVGLYRRNQVKEMLVAFSPSPPHRHPHPQYLASG